MLKNAAYPSSLDGRNKTKITDEGISLAQRDIQIMIWKKLSIKLESNNLHSVLTCIEPLEKALTLALQRCQQTMLNYQPSFLEPRLDNLQADIYFDNTITPGELYKSIRRLSERFGGDYFIPNNIEMQGEYRFNVKVVQQKLNSTRQQQKCPEVTISKEKVHIFGGMPLYMVIDLRDRMQLCYRDVADKYLFDDDEPIK